MCAQRKIVTKARSPTQLFLTLEAGGGGGEDTSYVSGVCARSNKMGLSIAPPMGSSCSKPKVPFISRLGPTQKRPRCNVIKFITCARELL